MTTKIKYKFVDGKVSKVEEDDRIVAYIKRDRWKESIANRRFHDKTQSVDYDFWEDMPFSSQWGNPEEELLALEIYEVLDRFMECLPPRQRKRFRMMLLDYSLTEIAHEEQVSIQSVAESVYAIRRKLQAHLKHKFDE